MILLRFPQIMQGLLDQHVVAGNGKALGMVVAMADYFAGRIADVIRRYSIERHWASLNQETGGMNDVLYQLYTITVLSAFSFLQGKPSSETQNNILSDWSC
jgi:hypothetical protein